MGVDLSLCAVTFRSVRTHTHTHTHTHTLFAQGARKTVRFSPLPNGRGGSGVGTPEIDRVLARIERERSATIERSIKGLGTETLRTADDDSSSDADDSFSDDLLFGAGGGGTSSDEASYSGSRRRRRRRRQRGRGSSSDGRGSISGDAALKAGYQSALRAIRALDEEISATEAQLT